MAAYFEPSPEQIKAACEEIRSEWSPETHASRAAVGAVPWSVPGVDRGGVKPETKAD
jgi:hypothetical protein